MLFIAFIIIAILIGRLGLCMCHQTAGLPFVSEYATDIVRYAILFSSVTKIRIQNCVAYSSSEILPIDLVEVVFKKKNSFTEW